MCTRMGFPAAPWPNSKSSWEAGLPSRTLWSDSGLLPPEHRMGFKRAGPKGTIQNAEPLTLPCVGQLSTSHWTGCEWEGRDQQSKAGGQAWSSNSVFTLVYLLTGCVHLEKL